MLSNIILRSTAAFGGAPFRLIKCTALGSAGAGAGVGAATGGVPGALVGGAYSYYGHGYDNTYINGYEVSKKTLSDIDKGDVNNEGN